MPDHPLPQVDLDVRADQPGAFVPVDDLPDVAVGDRVVVRSEHGDREATVVELLAEPRGRFARLDLDDA